MSLVTIKNKYQIVIPLAIRKAAGLKVGDILDVTFEKGKIILTLVEFTRKKFPKQQVG